jgi:hypothetical protein
VPESRALRLTALHADPAVFLSTVILACVALVAVVGGLRLGAGLEDHVIAVIRRGLKKMTER